MMRARNRACDNCARATSAVWYSIWIATDRTTFKVTLCGHCVFTSFMSPASCNRLAALAHSVANRSGKKKADAPSGAPAVEA
jgi:hypothetical protein